MPRGLRKIFCFEDMIIYTQNVVGVRCLKSCLSRIFKSLYFKIWEEGEREEDIIYSQQMCDIIYFTGQLTIT